MMAANGYSSRRIVYISLYWFFSTFLSSEGFWEVQFLKNLLKCATSSKPKISDISFTDLSV